MEHPRQRGSAVDVEIRRSARVAPQTSRPVARDPQEIHLLERASDPVVSAVNEERGTLGVVDTVGAPAPAVVPEGVPREAAAERQARVNRLMPKPRRRNLARLFRRHRILAVCLRRGRPVHHVRRHDFHLRESHDVHLDVTLVAAVEIRRSRNIFPRHRRNEHHAPDDHHESEFIDQRRGVPASREIGRQLRRHRRRAPLGDVGSRSIGPRQDRGDAGDVRILQVIPLDPVEVLVVLLQGSEPSLRASQRLSARRLVLVMNALPQRTAQPRVPRETHGEARVAVEFAPQPRVVVSPVRSAPRAKVHRAVGLTEESDARVAPPDASLRAVAEATHRDAGSRQRGQVVSVEVRRDGGHHLVRERQEGGLIRPSVIARILFGSPLGTFCRHGAGAPPCVKVEI
mmetsp:Transcript_11839/g.53399  ORF Transcript_11839/g.53399 Transcript_11839/m.53399 type:complete len:400 (-) Transcript_11839:8-1207(-)